MKIQSNPLPAQATLVAMAVAALLATAAAPALAVDGPVVFGEPTVMSEQGQRLKVVVPVRSAADDRATAVAFMVRETEVPQGFRPPAAQAFTVMRPAENDYVVFQSADEVTAPNVTLTVSVAGDPNSPYRMDLRVPASGQGLSGIQVADAGNRSGRATATDVPMRRLRGPVGTANLPPK